MTLREPETLAARARYTFHGNRRDTRYGWLRLTPAYSQTLVRELLEREVRDERPVLDPFSGTGTTVLSCAELGLRTQGVELNPFLVWLARCKVATYDARTIAAAGHAVDRMAQAACGRGEPRAWVPALHQIEKWWQPDVLDALSRAFAELRADASLSARARDLAQLVFCRTLIDAAQVSFGHQSMSFKRDAERGLSSDHVARSLEQAFASLRRSASIALARRAKRVSLGDARDLTAVLERAAYGTVITSPPYANRMSYIRELRPYMYWLGYLSDAKSAGALDWRAIGGTWGAATSNLSTWSPDPARPIPHPQFTGIVRRIRATSPILARYVERYFHDMRAHAESLYRVVARGGRIFYVVGNSKFYDVVLPLEEILARLFEESGFVSAEVRTLRKRTSKAELFEYLVSARKP